MLPTVQPARLETRREPFDHPDWLFELKYDGFRALAYIKPGSAKLISRKGNALKFPSLCDELARLPHEAILDGEVVCLDEAGRPLFYDLLFRRREPYFYAFDCVRLDGEDLRQKPLIERKRILRKIIPKRGRLLYAKHQLRRGVDLFRLVCEQDLEGIVAKRKNGWYGETWVKVKNPAYSQVKGRRELFEKRRG